MLPGFGITQVRENFLTMYIREITVEVLNYTWEACRFQRDCQSTDTYYKQADEHY